MTNKEENDKINNIISSIILSPYKNKIKIYSWKSLLNFELKEIEKPEKGYSLKWCEECSSFTCHFGKNCRKCQSKKYGLGNPEVHAKTIKSQIKNGTFNMLNPEVQKNKTSNENIKYTHKIKYCVQCNAETKHRVWSNDRSRCCLCDFKNNGLKVNFCIICNKETVHNGSMCNICYPDSITKGIWYEEKYCEICKSIQLFLYGKYCRRHEKEKCGNVDVVGIGGISNFKIINNIKYYFDNSLNKYIPWEDYKLKFITLLNTKFTDQIKLLYNNSQIISTFRLQNSTDWKGKRLAFENNLIDKKILWFSYIKFYINENKDIIPLVVGKTGSLLVNKNGTDVMFSTDVLHGPARLFLKETNNCWDKTQILIIPCETELQAFYIEKYICNKYNLFES